MQYWHRSSSNFLRHKTLCNAHNTLFTRQIVYSASLLVYTVPTGAIHLLSWFTVCTTCSLQAALASARYIDEELDGMLLATDVDVDAFLGTAPELEDTWAVRQHIYIHTALCSTLLC
jgi:hypothetical protein